jgi:hypothetical protein
MLLNVALNWLHCSDHRYGIASFNQPICDRCSGRFITYEKRDETAHRIAPSRLPRYRYSHYDFTVCQ